LEGLSGVRQGSQNKAKQNEPDWRNKAKQNEADWQNKTDRKNPVISMHTAAKRAPSVD
jgi:hypothetical protein